MEIATVAVLTIEEVRQQVIEELAKEIAANAVSLLTESANNTYLFDDRYCRRLKNDDKLMETWCERCSDNFFASHPEIVHVLCDTGRLDYSWLAKA